LNPDYHLFDAFPTLCKVYAIAVAIPIKPAHVRLCLKKNLKRCYYILYERKILMSLDKEQIITAFGGLTSELSKALDENV
jgi:hypothetical protein